MEKKIGILNNYADEPITAPSASYFAQFIESNDIINICHGEEISDINKYEGFIISGSRSCHKDQSAWINYLKEVISDIYLNNIPCLAVCFGHQIVADMFGGKTIVNSNGEEGFQDVPTSANNEVPKLFSDLPNPLKIYQSHNDAVLEVPKIASNVLKNEKCVQYYELGSIYSIQSHPEISVANAVNIAKRDNQNVETILNGVTNENIQSHFILKNFINLI